MFDFLRDIGQSAEDKRLEALNAYLDGALPAREQQVLEADLQRDAALRAELERLRIVRQELRAMPRRRVPRSFSLDPSLYGPPKAQPAQQLYPLLRGATALTALLFVFVLGLNLLNVNLGGEQAQVEAVTMAEPAAQFSVMAETPAAELELQAVPPSGAAAEAGIAIEEAAADNAETAADEAGTAETGAMTEAPKDIPEEAQPAPEASRAVPDITERIQPSGTAAALATAEVAGLAGDAVGGAAADAADESFAVLAAEEAPPSPSLPLGTVAAALGALTVVLGGLTLWLRSRRAF
jgi:anti-sigma factor RsiW